MSLKPDSKKKCGRCKERKPHSEFDRYPNFNHTYMKLCRDCMKKSTAHNAGKSSKVKDGEIYIWNDDLIYM
jgi:hypothetical protein